MANKSLKTIKFPGLDDTYTIPQDTSDLTNGAGFISSYTETDPTVPSWAKASTKPTYAASEISGLAAVATTGSYNSLSNKPTIPAAQVNSNWTATTGVASILNKPAIPSTYSDVGAMSAGTQVVHSVTVTPNFTSGQKIAEITVDSTTASVYAPEGTVQVNADWNASTGVASILNKPSIPAAQVNANWTATTGVASILNKPSIPSSAADVGAVPTSRTVNGKSLNANITLGASDVGALPSTTHIPADQVNSDWTATTGVSSILHKPSIPSTYSDVGAASASHGHGNISNDGKITDAGYLEGTPLTLIAADSTGTLALGPSITGSTGDAKKYLSDKGTFETVPAA